jgi:hypothetical protein
MRVAVIIKATRTARQGVLPAEDLLGAMGRSDEER